jgi:predicted naringenin-chalcone synthase
MKSMFITGLGTAVPPNRYTQPECYAALQDSAPFAALSPRSRAILRKVLLGDSGIEHRHFALDSLADGLDINPDVLHERFLRHAPALATQAAQRALASAGLTRESIGAVLVSTCTGYACPGLTSYVAERLGLKPDVIALDIVGQGCGAALPNMRAAQALLGAGAVERVISICVEVCSAAAYLEDDPGVLVSACLFGDGAGAAILANRPAEPGRQVEWVDSLSVLKPELRDLLRFEQRGGMLRNVLSLQVPALAAEAVEELLQQARQKNSLSPAVIDQWILHAGGRDVLAAVRKRLGLSVDQLRWSQEVLRDFGNLSSASVYFVLQRALAEGAPPGCWWLCSFGAGFACHGAWLKVSG